MARKVLTMEELAHIIDNWDDDDSDIDSVVILPPTNVDNVTDEENFDEDDILINEDISALQELAGTYEFTTRTNNESMSKNDSHGGDDINTIQYNLDCRGEHISN